MMKKHFNKKAILLFSFSSLLLYSNKSFCQFSSTSPGGSANQYNNAPVGIQISGTPLASTSLDLQNDLSIRGTHLIYNSAAGVIDWGNGSGNLYFRSLPSQGSIGGFNNLMTITYAGLVGINNMSPTVRLDVTDASGTIAAFRNGTSHILITANVGSWSYNHLTQANDNGIFWSDGLLSSGTQNENSGFVIAPWQTSTNGIRIDGVSGNFSVNGGVTQATLGSCAESATLNLATAYLGFNIYRNTSGVWTCLGDGTYNGAATIFGDIHGDIRFVNIPSTSGSTQTITSDANLYNNTNMLITPTGQVVIGSQTLGITIPGAYKLYVAGGILTEQVKVALVNSANWSDYVFGDNYKLKPLADVEQYIKVNKHLPDVPSATDLKSSGIDVVNMDATLLKKIEELTLYTIELQKENNKNVAKIEELTKQVQQLYEARK